MDSGSGPGPVSYRCSKEGIFWEGGVDSGSVAYLVGGGGILGKRGRFWEGGIYSGSVAYSCKKVGYSVKMG